MAASILPRIRSGSKRPHLFKRDGWYYLNCAEGGTAPQHSQAILRSRKVWGPDEPYEKNPILTQRDLPAGRAHPTTQRRPCRSGGRAGWPLVVRHSWPVAIMAGCTTTPVRRDLPAAGGMEEQGLAGDPATGARDSLRRTGVRLSCRAPATQAPSTGNFTWRDEFDKPTLDRALETHGARARSSPGPTRSCAPRPVAYPAAGGGTRHVAQPGVPGAPPTAHDVRGQHRVAGAGRSRDPGGYRGVPERNALVLPGCAPQGEGDGTALPGKKQRRRQAHRRHHGAAGCAYCAEIEDRRRRRRTTPSVSMRAEWLDNGCNRTRTARCSVPTWRGGFIGAGSGAARANSAESNGRNRQTTQGEQAVHNDLSRLRRSVCWRRCLWHTPGAHAAQAQTPSPMYQDTQRRIFEERAADLVSRMTLERGRADAERYSGTGDRTPGRARHTTGGTKRCTAWRARVARPRFRRR